jgi:hypothetical protein
MSDQPCDPFERFVVHFEFFARIGAVPRVWIRDVESDNELIVECVESPVSHGLPYSTDPKDWSPGPLTKDLLAVLNRHRQEMYKY